MSWVLVTVVPRNSFCWTPRYRRSFPPPPVYFVPDDWVWRRGATGKPVGQAKPWSRGLKHRWVGVCGKVEKPTQHNGLTGDKARVAGVLKSSVEARTGAWKGLVGRETAGREFWERRLFGWEQGNQAAASLEDHITGPDDKQGERNEKTRMVR